jgi:hypothetical protein
VPPIGVPLFQQYEAMVLPLVADHGGRLERRLRNGDGTVEVHVVWFPSISDFDAYRADPRRGEHQWLLDSSAALSELIEVTEVG